MGVVPGRSTRSLDVAMDSDKQPEIEKLRRSLEEEFDALPESGPAKVVNQLRREFEKANQPIPPQFESAAARFTAGETGYGELQERLRGSLTKVLFPRSSNGDI